MSRRPTLSNATIEELEAALAARRHAERVVRVPPEMYATSRVNRWEVTCPADAEGHRTTVIGVFPGHVLDAVAAASSVTVNPLTVRVADPLPVAPKGNVRASVYFDMGGPAFTAMSPEDRAAVVSSWLLDGPFPVRGDSYALGTVGVSNFHGAVELALLRAPAARRR